MKKKRLATTRKGDHLESDVYEGEMEEVFRMIQNFCEYYSRELVSLLRMY